MGSRQARIWWSVAKQRKQALGWIFGVEVMEGRGGGFGGGEDGPRKSASRYECLGGGGAAPEALPTNGMQEGSGGLPSGGGMRLFVSLIEAAEVPEAHLFPGRCMLLLRRT
jgi:hypothetical protein